MKFQEESPTCTTRNRSFLAKTFCYVLVLLACVRSDEPDNSEGSGTSLGTTRDSTEFNPSVAISGDTVVEVHNGQGEASQTWSHVGKISGKKIRRQAAYNYDWGYNSKIAAFVAFT